ncbi:MAG TPA: hypothetical protein VF263_08945 [Longimicrobiaceae bacterium]
MKISLAFPILAVLSCTLFSPANAQQHEESRGGSVEYFVARSRMALGGGRTDLDGVGGRILWSLARRDAPPLVSRMTLGGYVVHTPEDTEDVEMWHYGVQADLRLPGPGLVPRVDPLLSLGVGAVRVEEEPGTTPTAPPLLLAAEPRSAPARPETSLSVVPGVGAKLRLVPGLDFRGDLRMVVDFRDRTTRNLELSGGISIPT